MPCYHIISTTKLWDVCEDEVFLVQLGWFSLLSVTQTYGRESIINQENNFGEMMSIPCRIYV